MRACVRHGVIGLADRQELGVSVASLSRDSVSALPQSKRYFWEVIAVNRSNRLGCQREITQQIIQGGAEYVLVVKGNQGSLG